MFLQRKDLILADIANKFKLMAHLSRNTQNLFSIFQENARKLPGHNLIEITNLNETEDKINNFNRIIKVLFLEEVLKELDMAFSLDDPVLLAFDAFNVSSDFDLEKREQCPFNILW